MYVASDLGRYVLIFLFIHVCIRENKKRSSSKIDMAIEEQGKTIEEPGEELKQKQGHGASMENSRPPSSARGREHLSTTYNYQDNY
jgi:hypothetical protein